MSSTERFNARKHVKVSVSPWQLLRTLNCRGCWEKQGRTHPQSRLLRNSIMITALVENDWDLETWDRGITGFIIENLKLQILHNLLDVQKGPLWERVINLQCIKILQALPIIMVPSKTKHILSGSSPISGSSFYKLKEINKITRLTISHP